MSTDSVKNPTAAADHALAHIVPPKVLGAVFAALVLLTVATVAVANVDLGSMNIYAALGIARRQGHAGGALLHAPALRPAVQPDHHSRLPAVRGSLHFAGAERHGNVPPFAHSGEAPSMKEVHAPLGR